MVLAPSEPRGDARDHGDDDAVVGPAPFDPTSAWTALAAGPAPLNAGATAEANALFEELGRTTAQPPNYATVGTRVRAISNESNADLGTIKGVLAVHKSGGFGTLQTSPTREAWATASEREQASNLR